MQAERRNPVECLTTFQPRDHFLIVPEKHTKKHTNMNFNHVKFFENDLPKALWGILTVFSNTALH